jgi:hypothetical protein
MAAVRDDKVRIRPKGGLMDTTVIKFAQTAHGTQKYATRLPYIVHLTAVYGVLVRFGVNDDTILTAAWLHDVLEKTGVRFDEIVDKFGVDVAALVALVTNEPGESRKSRQAITYPKIKSSISARTLKLADRIANVEACFKNDGVDSIFSMYSREFEDFIKYLFPGNEPERPGRDAEDAMWKHLIGLVVAGRRALNDAYPVRHNRENTRMG